MLKIALPLALAAFLVAAFTPYQGDEPAEKVFKNIISFKGTPAKDIMPAMRFMNASLKVQCGYCHDPNDYSADVRGEKKTAREMIEMQREINQKFFEGRNEVTCNSCHNGLTHPAGAPVLPGITNRHKRVDPSLKPADIIKKHVDAAGNLPAVSFTGKVQVEHFPDQKCELIQTADGKFRLTIGRVTMGFDGVKTWRSENGQTYEMWGDPAAVTKRQGRPMRGDRAFAGYENLRITGSDPVGGANAIIVRGGVNADGLTEELYFDEATGLLSRVTTLTRSPIGLVPSFFDFSDYREVGGAKLPFKIVQTTEEGKVITMVLAEANPNPTVDEKTFSPPAG